MITLVKISDGKYEVKGDNGVYLGDFIMDVDGFFYFRYGEGGGLWTSHVIRSISDELDKLNKDWEEVSINYFNISSFFLRGFRLMKLFTNNLRYNI
jgi:hypothetical protein